MSPAFEEKSNRPEMRIGNPERNHALELLSAHFANGYLGPDEFHDRTGQAVIARTQSDLDKVFHDLPGYEGKDLHKEVQVDHEGDQELDDVLRRGEKVQIADGVIWTVAIAFFVVGLFVFDWGLFWAPIPVAGICSMVVRAYFNFDDDEEEIFEELSDTQKSQRKERLQQAAERRRELGTED